MKVQNLPVEPWTLAASLGVVTAGIALLFGQWSLAGSHDVVGVYWLLTGAVALRASLIFARKHAP